MKCDYPFWNIIMQLLKMIIPESVCDKLLIKTGTSQSSLCKVISFIEKHKSAKETYICMNAYLYHLCACGWKTLVN